MKFAIIFIGESFRQGNQGCRTIGTPQSFEPQRQACESHRRWLAQYSPNECDVYVSTVETCYTQDLIEWYRETKCLVNYITVKPHMSSFQLHFQNAVQMIKQEYEFVFIIRIDLVLKKYFCDIWKRAFNKNILQEKIVFPSICWTRNNSHIYRMKPRVNDTMMCIPKRYISLFKQNKLVLCHEAWYIILFINALEVTDEDFALLLDTFHDSDSYKDWNPIYYFCGRPESQEHFSKGFVFDQVTKSAIAFDPLIKVHLQ